MQGLAPCLRMSASGCAHSRAFGSLDQVRPSVQLPRRRIHANSRIPVTQCKASQQTANGPLQYFTKAWLLAAGGMAGPVLAALADEEPASQIAAAVDSVAAPASDAVAAVSDAAAAVAPESNAVLFGLSQTELIIIAIPLVVYGTFSLYRKFFNPQAKIMNFLFVVWSLCLTANVVSIIVFKKRYL